MPSTRIRINAFLLIALGMSGGWMTVTARAADNDFYEKQLRNYDTIYQEYNEEQEQKKQGPQGTKSTVKITP